MKVVKNKIAPPFRQAEFDIMYGKGISREGSLLDVGVDLGIVKKSGAWFTYEGEQLGQGRENVKPFLAENVDMMVEISEKIKTERRHRRGRSDVDLPPRRPRATKTVEVDGSTPRKPAIVASARAVGSGQRRIGPGAAQARARTLAAVTGRFFVRTYGCQMNEHDSERIAGLLVDEGMEPTDDLDDADVVVLNTCCIRENADNKLYGHLGRLKALKDRAARPADRGRRLPRPEGPRPRRASGRRTSTSCSAPTTSPTRPALLASGPRARGPDRRDPRGARGVPVGAAGPARGRPRGLGHDPDRLRQLVRVLHRAVGAGRAR